MFTHRHRLPDGWSPLRVPWQRRDIVADRTHPLCPDRLYMPQLRLADLVTGQPVTITSAGGYPITPYQSIIGPASGWQNIGGSGCGFLCGTGPFLGGLGAWSIFALMTATVNSASGSTLYSERAASGNDILKLHVTQSGTADAACVYRNDAGSLVNPTTGSSGVNVNDGGVHGMAAVYDGVNVYAYADGRLASQTTWPGANNNFTDASIQQTIGYDVADANGNFAGIIYCVYLYRRVLTPLEIGRLARDPFGMLVTTSQPVMGKAATQALATQIALELWSQGTPQAQLTQLALEQWQSVGVTAIKSGVYTYPITGTRAGLSGIVAETATKTYMTAMPAVLTEGYIAPTPPPSTGGAQARVCIMA